MDKVRNLMACHFHCHKCGCLIDYFRGSGTGNVNTKNLTIFCICNHFNKSIGFTNRQGFTIVGFVRAGDEEARIEGERVINLRQPLAEYTRQTEIDKIVVALDDDQASLPADELFQCRLNGVKVVDLVNFFEQEAGKVLVDFATPGWMSFTHDFPSSKSSNLAKRWFDIFASFMLLVFSWPVMLLTALAIWLEDGFGSPVFFRQERVGLHGETFQVLKFRSMTVDAEGDGKAVWATRNDSRVTRVGNFIRKTRIDELPQILNVLSGKMAFIGPRPERPEFVEELAESIPYFNARHCVKPGITGWAQLCYPYGASVNDAKQKLQFDLYYVKNHSLFLDFMISLNNGHFFSSGFLLNSVRVGISFKGFDNRGGRGYRVPACNCSAGINSPQSDSTVAIHHYVGAYPVPFLN